MSIYDYFLGTIVAMGGDGCYGIATDKRFGVRHTTMETNYSKAIQVDDYAFLGLPGIPTDITTFSQKFKFRKNMFELREGRKMTPQMMASLVSNMLYEKRFGSYILQPVFAGLDIKTNKPVLSSYDSIGSYRLNEDFVTVGTGGSQANGLCEQYWQPNMKPDELFEVLSQCILGALERDAGSGWGVIVHIVEKDKITTTELKSRMD